MPFVYSSCPLVTHEIPRLLISSHVFHVTPSLFTHPFLVHSPLPCLLTPSLFTHPSFTHIIHSCLLMFTPFFTHSYPLPPYSYPLPPYSPPYSLPYITTLYTSGCVICSLSCASLTSASSSNCATSFEAAWRRTCGC